MREQVLSSERPSEEQSDEWLDRIVRLLIIRTLPAAPLTLAWHAIAISIDFHARAIRQIEKRLFTGGHLRAACFTSATEIGTFRAFHTRPAQRAACIRHRYRFFT